MKKSMLLFVILLCYYAARPQAVLVIRNVTVIDLQSGKPLPNRMVIIKGNRISYMGKAIATPPDVKSIDGTGKYLIPGLWDMHTHVLTDKRYEFAFPLLIANGITGVREMGNNLPTEQVKQLKKELDDGSLPGPRLGHFTYRILDGPGTQLNVAEAVKDAEQGMELVRSYKQEGADFIKPYNLLSREVYEAIADEAIKQKIPLQGHVPFSMTAAEVSALGQQCIEHNFDVLLSCSSNEEVLRKQLAENTQLWGQVEALAAGSYDKEKAKKVFRLFAHNGTWFCPTTIFYRLPVLVGSDSAILRDSILQYIPAATKERWHQNFQRFSATITLPAYRSVHYEARSRLVYEMYHHGVGILAGTDMGAMFTVPGFSLHRELEEMVRAGLSPLEALRTATINPARFLKREKDFGGVEKGKLADLVLLDADPLADIRHTQRITAVILNGRLLERKDLDALLLQVKIMARQ